MDRQQRAIRAGKDPQHLLHHLLAVSPLQSKDPPAVRRWNIASKHPQTHDSQENMGIRGLPDPGVPSQACAFFKKPLHPVQGSYHSAMYQVAAQLKLYQG